MRTPEYTHEVTHLLQAMQDQGMLVSFSRGDDFVVASAMNVNGEIVQVRRDDVDLLAAVIECAGKLGWDLD